MTRTALVVAVMAASMVGCSGASAGADSLEGRLDNAYADAAGVLGDGASALRDSGSCLADTARDTWGDERVEAYGIEGSTIDTAALVEELGDQADQFEQLVKGCVDVRDTLISGFEGIGLGPDSAACSADVVLNDPQLRTSLVVQLLFADPGIGTALVAAARVARQCLSPDELPLIGEGA